MDMKVEEVARSWEKSKEMDFPQEHPERNSRLMQGREESIHHLDLILTPTPDSEWALLLCPYLPAGKINKISEFSPVLGTWKFLSLVCLYPSPFCGLDLRVTAINPAQAVWELTAWHSAVCYKFNTRHRCQLLTYLKKIFGNYMKRRGGKGEITF